jgi:large subunit ribosomal protein L18
MMKIKTTKDRRKRISLRQRKRISGTAERPRLRVFRSVSHIYVQVIDDMNGTTLVSAASTEPASRGSWATAPGRATSPARRRSGGRLPSG